MLARQSRNCPKRNLFLLGKHESKCTIWSHMTERGRNCQGKTENPCVGGSIPPPATTSQIPPGKPDFALLGAPFNGGAFTAWMSLIHPGKSH